MLAAFDRERGRGAANCGRYSNPALDDGRREAVPAEATRLAIRDVALVPLHHGRVA